MIIFIYDSFRKLVPKKIRRWIASRWGITDQDHEGDHAFDLIRASVNLMVAAAVISFATSKKLPLSTTYVTFMVAMGTALADRAWTRECAPSRIAGVLTVVGGWFVTAIMAFMIAGFTVTVLYFTKSAGLVALVLLIVYIIYKLGHLHDKRSVKSA